jgi:quercetin dioxygenase-like cupin family protein
MGDTQTKLSVSHAADAKYESFGPGGIYRTRDLGVKAATGGAFEARVLGAAEPCKGSLGAHRHDVTFQMFYVLRGWGKFHFEGAGEVEVTVGSAVHMPPGIVHDMVDHSDDFEFIEILSPAQFDTQWMKPAKAGG